MMTLAEKVVELECEGPVDIGDFDFASVKKNPYMGFVYYREYGMFYVDWAKHTTFMAEIHAFIHGYESVFDMDYPKGKCPFDHFADEFLRTEGTCYMSSCSASVCVWHLQNLDEVEQRYFRKRYKLLQLGD